MLLRVWGYTLAIVTSVSFQFLLFFTCHKNISNWGWRCGSELHTCRQNVHIYKITFKEISNWMTFFSRELSL